MATIEEQISAIAVEACIAIPYKPTEEDLGTPLKDIINKSIIQTVNDNCEWFNETDIYTDLLDICDEAGIPEDVAESRARKACDAIRTNIREGMFMLKRDTVEIMPSDASSMDYRCFDVHAELNVIDIHNILVGITRAPEPENREDKNLDDDTVL